MNKKLNMEGVQQNDFAEARPCNDRSLERSVSSRLKVLVDRND